MADYNTLKNKCYIYFGKNNKLVLHDFLYEIIDEYEFVGKSELSEFAINLVNKIADRIYIWQLHNNEINSTSVKFYIGLYKFIEKNGGIRNCDKLSEYTYNINDLESVKKLVRTGELRKIEVKIQDNELNLPTIVNADNTIKITAFNVIRDSKKYLVLPDNIFNAYKCFIGDSAFEFADFVISKTGIANINNELRKYYAAIFKLIEKEKYCITVSEFCKNKKNNSNQEYIQQMLKSKKATIHSINIDEKGNISIKLIDNVQNLDNTAYNTTKEDLKNTENKHKAVLQTAISNIDSELKTLTTNLNISTSDEYIAFKKNLKGMRDKISNVYNYVQQKCQANEIQTVNIVEKTEKKYNEIIQKIEKLAEKAEKIYTANNKPTESKEKDEKTDYFEQIQSELNSFEEELNSITQNMTVNSEKDYSALNAKLTNLRDRLQNFYDKSLSEAHENESLTGALLKEATTKNNELTDKIDEAFKNLELLKKKLLFKNIFSG